jgi:hypothetical protein
MPGPLSYQRLAGFGVAWGEDGKVAVEACSCEDELVAAPTVSESSVTARAWKVAKALVGDAAPKDPDESEDNKHPP